MNSNNNSLSICDLSALDATSIDNFALLVGISRAKAYSEVKSKRVNKIKIGARSLITREERIRYLDSLSCQQAAEL